MLGVLCRPPVIKGRLQSLLAHSAGDGAGPGGGELSPPAEGAELKRCLVYRRPRGMGMRGEHNQS
eukprot:gene12724-13424_t